MRVYLHLMKKLVGILLELSHLKILALKCQIALLKTEPYKNGDFNADGKEDIMVYLGACGTGGCMYPIFLNQNKNYYKLAFMDYLKEAQFEKEKNGFISVKSYVEIEPIQSIKTICYTV